MQYMDVGDMKSMCTKKGQFAEGTAQFYGAQLILGIDFLHSCGIIRR